MAKQLTHPDEIYLDMVKRVLKNEKKLKANRTSVKTIGVVGHQAVYPLKAYYTDGNALVVENYPILTTRKMFTKGMFAELFWLINGQTNIEFLEKNNVHFWTNWPRNYYNSQNPDDQLSLEEFQKAIVNKPGFAQRWGWLGPVYGKQWREWETYRNNEVVFIDQFRNAVDTLKTNPSSRRIVVSAWNPADLEEQTKSGLPACHYCFQFIATPDESGGHVLDLIMIQRSADIFLGVSTNVLSYATLLCMVAKHVGMLPGNFIHQIGDCHIYENHISQIKEQKKRTPLTPPTLIINGDPLGELLAEPIGYRKLDYFYYRGFFDIHDYKSHPQLTGEVAE